MSEFVEPSWDAPLDIEATIAAVPETATVKGMFFHAPLQQAKRVRGVAITDKRFVGFKDYAVREHMRVLADCAGAVHPNSPTREGLRRLGRDAYDTFAASMVGRVVMSVTARQWEGVVKVVGRAYSVVGNTSAASVETLGEGETHIRVTGVWNFPDCYHVGILEAAMRAHEVSGVVKLCAHAQDSYTYELTWRV